MRSNKDLADLLTQKDPEETPQETSIFTNLYITEGALAKAKAYARKVCEVFNSSVECYGYLITPKGVKDRIVRDAYLAPGQKISAADVSMDGASVIQAGKEIDAMGHKVLGWWHSHADFDPFHSETDDENMLSVLNSIAPVNYRTVYREREILSGNLTFRINGTKVEVYDKKEGKSVGASLQSKAKLPDKITSLRIRVPVKVGFAYSIVVNSKGDRPYTEIATKEWCDSCYEIKDESRWIAGLRVMKIENDVKVDEEAISKEIKAKIKKPSFGETWFGGYDPSVDPQTRGIFRQDPNKRGRIW